MLMFLYFIFIFIPLKAHKKGPRRVLSRVRCQRFGWLLIQNLNFNIILVTLILQVLTHALGVYPFAETPALDLPVFVLLGEISVAVVVDVGSEGLDFLEVGFGIGTVSEST